MNDNNKALAVLDRVATVAKPPKPTKKQLLRATARLIVEKKIEEYKERVDKQRLLKNKIVSLAKPDSWEIEDISLFSYREGPIIVQRRTSMMTTEQEKLFVTYRKEEEELRGFEYKYCNEESVYSHLVRASNTEPPVIENLLADEDICKKLLKAGEALLKLPTAEDKSKAINV